MTIRIVQYAQPPGTAEFRNPQFFGGDSLEPILVGDGGLTSSSTKLEIDGGSFFGLRAELFGNFTFLGQEISGQVDRVKFFYNDQLFHAWFNVKWDVDDVEEAIEKFDDGQRDAIDIFAAAFDYKFVLHKTHPTDNHLMTTDDDDTVQAQAMNPGAGVSYVFTFEGDDTVNLKRMHTDTYIDSGKGNDTVQAGSGNDQIRSFGGRDVLKGGRGDDNIDGQAGRDRVYGQGGDDSYLTGGRHNDRVFGGRGNDSISDSKGFNRMFGQGGDDTISGRGLLNGGVGNDTLNAFGGSNRFVGGRGDDKMMAASQETDVFDFRLGKAKDFGNDRVTGYNFEFDTKWSDLDELWFDKGVDVEVRHLKKRGIVELTAELDGAEIGTVKFGTKGMIDSFMAHSLIAGIEDQITFL